IGRGRRPVLRCRRRFGAVRADFRRVRTHWAAASSLPGPTEAGAAAAEVGPAAEDGAAAGADAAGAGPRFCPVAAPNRGRPYCVSTFTVALNPPCNGYSAGSTFFNSIRTGNRCTTFTQLPVAFSAGSSENCEPVPGLTLATAPTNVLPG